MNINKIMEMALENPQIVSAVAKQFGLSEQQAGQAASGLIGALAGGVERNVKQGGLQSLMGALEKGQHDQYLDQPDQLAQNTEEGNKILGHVLGSKEASREVAGQVGAQTGVSPDIIKQMLPMVAMMAMGAMSKTQKQQGSSTMMGMLGNILDQDGDGNPLNDIMGMVMGGKRS